MYIPGVGLAYSARRLFKASDKLIMYLVHEYDIFASQLLIFVITIYIHQ